MDCSPKFLICQVVLMLATAATTASSVRSFSIDFDNDTFVKDGRPYRYISGSIHYFRVPREYWRSRLTQMRVAGLTAVQTYVEWSSHQPEINQTVFTGNLDLVEFLNTAASLGFDVILRPGPYIDAERDLGGLPYWLLKDASIKLRTGDPKFMKAVEDWFRVLFDVLKGQLYHEGGPVIMIQVENEYGSYGLQTGHCDKRYLGRMRDLLRQLVGPEPVFFTTDGNSEDLVMCGQIPGVYSTVDFGPGADVHQAFEVQRLFEPRGPLVNSEFYPGWLDHWQAKHSRVSTEAVVKTLEAMLDLGANVNIYLMHGGTSFGLTAGSNYPPFQATPTSYDYDAPISEAGDLGEKYWAIRSTIGKYRQLPAIPPTFPNATDKGALGPVHMRYVGSLLEAEKILFTFYGLHKYPATFEDLGQAFGLMLYTTEVDGLYTDPAVLHIPGLADRGYVFIDSRPVGILSREGEVFALPLQILPGQKLQILVENQGRICYGPNLMDRKGIVGNVTLANTVLTNWNISGLNLKHPSLLHKYSLSMLGSQEKANEVKYAGRMSLWTGVFTVEVNSVKENPYPLDTFIQLPGWQKGLVMVNNVLLGRYWPRAGPQETLYLPGPLLLPAPLRNRITILEQDGPLTACLPHCPVLLVARHQIDGPTPSDNAATAADDEGVGQRPFFWRRMGAKLPSLENVN